MSELFWAVMDDKQKKKSEEILATFDKDSKDEMGLMSITIALSSLMFPGTSVLHTRLRYVFLVGWIFLEAMKKNDWTIETLHKKEKKLRKTLQEKKKNNKDSFLGILGSTKLIDSDGDGEELSQPPFNVYFNLLKEWDIIQDNNISADEIYRDIFDSEYLKITEKKFKNDTFELTEEEKAYIIKKIPPSILHTIFEKNIALENKQHFVNFDISNIDNIEQNQIFKNAQYFSFLMWGTMLYYNYYLGNESDDLKNKFNIWKQSVKIVIDSDWKPNKTLELIEGDSVVSNTQKLFINNWFEYVKKNINKLNLADPIKIQNIELKEFLQEREKGLKGNRSRLLKKQNGESFEEAKFGINPIQYRWSNIVRFKKDFDATN